MAEAYEDSFPGLIGIYTIADGPSGCLLVADFAEMTDELMNWASAAGGFLIDFDNSHCILFGTPQLPEDGDYEPAALTALQAFDRELGKGPEALLAFVAPMWAGWTIEWNDRGVDAFADYLTSRGVTSITTQPPSAPETASKRATLRADS
ncbi:MAG: hypothetical protein DLM59_14125 [Pseudonocardiales bacterium]|nr:MAG: hypothetical protein DLM59_14125 [Pseudonocardiales bacterium]